MHGAPDTVLQTPCNLFRNDSARDIHQMYEHFNVINRFAAVRLSSNAERSSTEDTASEERENIHTDSSGELCELDHVSMENIASDQENDIKSPVNELKSNVQMNGHGSNNSSVHAEGAPSPHPFHPSQQVNMAAAPFNMNGMYLHPPVMAPHPNHYLTTPTPHHPMYKFQYGNTVAVGTMQVYAPTSDGAYMQNGEVMMPMLHHEYYHQPDGTVYYALPMQHQPPTSLQSMQPQLQLQLHPSAYHANYGGAPAACNTGSGNGVINYGQHGGRSSFSKTGMTSSVGGRKSQVLSQVGLETCQNAMAGQDSINEIHQATRETQVNV